MESLPRDIFVSWLSKNDLTELVGYSATLWCAWSLSLEGFIVSSLSEDKLNSVCGVSSWGLGFIVSSLREDELNSVRGVSPRESSLSLGSEHGIR